MVTPAKLLRVNVAVNDPMTGNPANRISRIQIDEGHTIHLDGYGHELPIEFLIQPGGRWMVVNGHSYRFWTHEVWVGNWCWDQVSLSVADAADLVNQLLLSGWVVEEADRGLFERMNTERRIRMEDLAA